MLPTHFRRVVPQTAASILKCSRCASMPIATPLGMEGQPPGVHKAADAEASGSRRLLPLVVGRLCRVCMAVLVAGVVTPAACSAAVCMSVLPVAVLVAVGMAVPPMAVLLCLTYLQRDCRKSIAQSWSFSYSMQEGKMPVDMQLDLHMHEA